MPLGVIAACYILSRALFWFLGVRFASSEVEYFWQYLDTSLLKHQLWTSILYLHSEPPLMNLFYGAMLKAFPTHWPMVAYSFNLLFGQFAYMAIYIIISKSNVAHPIAMGVVILAMCNPSAVVYEAEPFYTHTVFCLLVFATYLFQSYLRQPKIGVGAAFLGILTALVLWRSSYQLAWYALYALWLIKITPSNMLRKIVILALIFGGIIGSLYIKNRILFGVFNTSSGTGMSLAKSWAGTPNILRLVQEKKLSPISSIYTGSSMDKYLPEIGPLPSTGVKAVDAIFKDNGSMNLNNIGYPEVSKLYTRDYLRLVKLSPMTIAKQIGVGWIDYFRTSSVWISAFDPANQSSVEDVDRWYRYFFCTGAEKSHKFSAPGDHHNSEKIKLLIKLRSVCWYSVLIYVVFALFLVYMPFQRWIASEDRSRRQLLLFLITNIAYSSVLCNAVEVGENMRYRYDTQGLLVIAATIIGYQVVRSFPHVENASRSVEVVCGGWANNTRNMRNLSAQA